ncbi:MAG TPA: hypothetical protein VK148_22130 [Xanthobacteraceae bacterium]|jgi:hypothetical protein|nr:hypothetical protein [Xanthobacteraceae bacterium]
MENSQKPLERDTVVVPVVTLEEVPVPTEEEQAELVASLKQAEADVAAGRTKPFDRETLKKRFLAICNGEIA